MTINEAEARRQAVIRMTIVFLILFFTEYFVGSVLIIMDYFLWSLLAYAACIPTIWFMVRNIDHKMKLIRLHLNV